MTFNSLRRLYDDNKFTELLNDPDGAYWLKLRSVSRADQLRQLCERIEIDCEDTPSRQLLELVFNHKPDERVIDNFIREIYEIEREQRRANEDYLISQLYQMRVLDWGGLYQNSLEQTIVDNYIKRIQSWDELNNAIDEDLFARMRGYVQSSWYNHWSSIIIEDIFKDHPTVLPAVGLVKKVDFFIQGVPFDLKVTFFPDGYMHALRRSQGFRPEFTLLKSFARGHGIWFDQQKPENVLFPELMTRISESPSDVAHQFMNEFKGKRAELIQQTIDDPSALKIWLYENQGVRRFDAANRFFLILIDPENIEESWKLKRNKELLSIRINDHLNNLRAGGIEHLKLRFNWENETYETYADIQFVIAG